MFKHVSITRLVYFNLVLTVWLKCIPFRIKMNNWFHIVPFLRFHILFLYHIWIRQMSFIKYLIPSVPFTADFVFTTSFYFNKILSCFVLFLFLCTFISQRWMFQYSLMVILFSLVSIFSGFITWKVIFFFLSDIIILWLIWSRLFRWFFSFLFSFYRLAVLTSICFIILSMVKPPFHASFFFGTRSTKC